VVKGKVPRHERRNDLSIAVVACRWETRQTVVRAVTGRRTDFRGLLMKLWRTLPTFSFEVLGRPDDFPLHKQPVSLRVWCHRRTLWAVGGSMLNCCRILRRTVLTDSHFSKRSSQIAFCCSVGISTIANQSASLCSGLPQRYRLSAKNTWDFTL